MTKTYTGSCHCGRVGFEVELDLGAGTSRCNCTMCWKTRAWKAIVKPAAFRLLGGVDQLAAYARSAAGAGHPFCRHCGVRTFERGELAALGGAFVAIHIESLDGVDPAELARAPVSYLDGRNDRWYETPAETRHL
jgi:hypothetical protein